MRFDFPTIIVLLVFATGFIWAFDALVLTRRRRAAARAMGDMGEDVVEAPPSRIVEYARSFFPVFLIVFVLRSFIVEPFRIPSNSMMPTLLTGDFILVNKFNYGIRLPVLDAKVVDVGRPERGDVVVFRFPGGSDHAVHQARRRHSRRSDRLLRQGAVRQRRTDGAELGGTICRRRVRGGHERREPAGGANRRRRARDPDSARSRARSRAPPWCPRGTTSCWATIATTAGTAATGVRCPTSC